MVCLESLVLHFVLSVVLENNGFVDNESICKSQHIFDIILFLVTNQRKILFNQN